jgi:hypothetical protein
VTAVVLSNETHPVELSTRSQFLTMSLKMNEKQILAEAVKSKVDQRFLPSPVQVEIGQPICVQVIAVSSST